MGMPGQVETILNLHRNSPRPRPTGPATITLAVATFQLAPAATAVDITGKVHDKKTNDPLSGDGRVQCRRGRLPHAEPWHRPVAPDLPLLR